MRIISGNFKGKKILQPKDNLTRPLKDLTKESIFNLINHSKKINLDFKNSIVLDLFSGVGSFGIECLSRGVKYVVFYENYNGVLPILKKNLKFLKNLENFKIIENDIYVQPHFGLRSALTKSYFFPISDEIVEESKTTFTLNGFFTDSGVSIPSYNFEAPVKIFELQQSHAVKPFEELYRLSQMDK